jgi:uncharacterized protein YbcI
MREATAVPRGEVAATISREAVKILRDYTGRGPTKVRTVINTDLVVINFADALTKGEAKLVELGRSGHVLQMRRDFQAAMKDELVELVESALGRKVIAFMSDNHLDPDVAIEAFVLEREDLREPGGDGRPASRRSLGSPTQDGRHGPGPAPPVEAG